MRRELILLGIDVIVIAPGAVATPIWDKADTLDVGRYAGTPYAAPLGAREELHARARPERPDRGSRSGIAIHKALTIARPRTRYVVAPDRLLNVCCSSLPKRMVDRLIARRFGLLQTRASAQGASVKAAHCLRSAR